MFSNKLAKISHWNRNPIRPMFSALRVEANRKDIKKNCVRQFMLLSLFGSHSRTLIFFIIYWHPQSRMGSQKVNREKERMRPKK